MENDISSTDSAILAANDLELSIRAGRQSGGEIFVSLINGKSVTGREIRRADGVRYETRAERDFERERESLFDDLANHVPGK